MSAETKPELDLILGSDVADSSGSKAGTLESKFVDPVVDSPDWIVVATGLLRGKPRLVPLVGAQESDGKVQLAFTKDQISDAPEPAEDGEFSEELERKAYEHYGLDWADYDPERQYGDRKMYDSEGAPVTYDEDAEIRDPESGTRPDPEDMVLPEHHEGVRPHPEEESAVETSGPITPPTRAGGADDPSAGRDD